MADGSREYPKSDTSDDPRTAYSPGAHDFVNQIGLQALEMAPQQDGPGTTAAGRGAYYKSSSE